MKKSFCIAVATTFLAITCLTGCKGQYYEEKDLTTMVGRISYSARKYDETLNRKKILENTGLSSDSLPTKGNYFKLLYSAFKDILPEATKGRKIMGNFTTKQSDKTSWSDEYKFFFDRGLIDYDFNFTPDQSITEDEQNLILNRIHTYMGTSYLDDFGTACNYEILYGEDSPEEASDGMIYNSLLSEEKLVDRCEEILKECSAQNKFKSKSLTDLYKMKDRSYSYENDEIYTTIQNKAKNVTTATQWFEYEKSIINSTYHSVCFSISEDYMLMQILAEPEKTKFQINTTEFAETLYTCASPYLASEIGSVLATKLGAFGFDWSDDEIKEIANIDERLPELLYDAFDDPALNTVAEDGVYSLEDYDPFQMAGLPSNMYYVEMLPDVIKDNIKYFNITGKMIGVLYGIGKAMQDPTLVDDLALLSKWNWLFKYRDTFLKETDSNYKFSIEEILAYGDLMFSEYFKSTDEYQYSVTTLRYLFQNKLKPALKEIFNRSEWLSSDGNKILTGKLNDMKSSFMFEYEGHEYDASDVMNVPGDKGLLTVASGTRAVKIANAIKGACENEGGLSSVFFYLMSPLTANCCYIPYTNAFYIFNGLLLSREPMQKLSGEEILAEFGIVIGHEMTHGFDDTGIYYDSKGKYVSSTILRQDDRDAFKALSDKMVEYYDGAEIVTGIATKGSNVVGEAIADQGGLDMCLTIARKVFGFNYKNFFLDLGAHFYTGGNRSMASTMRSDSHPGGAVRINKLLANNEKFAKTFNPEPGDFMYVNPNDFIVVW